MTTSRRSIALLPSLAGVLLAGILFAGVLFAGVLLACGGKPGSAGDALVGVTVIDGRGNPPVPGRVVVIRDGRIAGTRPLTAAASSEAATQAASTLRSNTTSWPRGKLVPGSGAG